MNLPIHDEKMKELLKEALTEMIQENHGIFYDLFLEVIEEIGLINAMKEGKQNNLVSKEKIMSILKGD